MCKTIKKNKFYQLPTEVICFYRRLDDSENRRWFVIKDGTGYYWENLISILENRFTEISPLPREDTRQKSGT